MMDAPGSNANLFPCIEQPLRVTLHCNGFYLWGLRNGKLIARKRRSEKDEFRLRYCDGTVVTIQNHKFNGYVSLISVEGDVPKLACVKDQEETKENEESDKKVGNSSQPKDQPTPNDDSDDEFVDEPNNSTIGNMEDRKWCFIKGSHGSNGVILKSLKTGENLAIDSQGNIVFATDILEDSTTSIMWDIECVTGELCYLSNPRLDSRIRCDMAGLTTLSDNWKGWEVFRLMEAGHGYVKISSWMHSQWLLCSTAEGRVTTCSHSESFIEGNPTGCSKWAIEKSPTGKGVVVRSKTSGRLLSVDNGVLSTYDHGDMPRAASGIQAEEIDPNDKRATEDKESEAASAGAPQGSSSSVETSGKEGSSLQNNWWSNGLKRMQNEMKDMQQKFNSAAFTGDLTQAVEVDAVDQKDTIEWHLEAAHLQTYYLSNDMDGENPKSMGPFPQVTENLRQTNKFQLIRDGDVTKLYDPDSKQYMACYGDGRIAIVEDAEDESTDWIMEKPSYQDGRSSFKSKLHNLYLSYKDVVEEDAGEADKGQFNLFQGKAENVSTLVGSETIGIREIWRLDPCMPRAVSSAKIKTFALGTSIAVGTTIAMPFALAGVGAIMGAVGAEVGLLANIVAVGLSGAEAIASVGAIGATAYIVFRPEENSLTDDHQNEEEEEERGWSKRPFSNWRNW